MGVNWDGWTVMKAVSSLVDQGLASLCNDIVETAKAKMLEPKTGHDYRKKWRRQGKKSPGKNKKTGESNEAGYFKSVSSAPGEAPAVQSSDLYLNVNQRKIGRQRFIVGTDLKHGAYMEVGTKNILPRPYLRPSVYEKTGRQAEVHFADKLK